MTGKEILEAEFDKAGMRGYNAEQVDSFLQSVATFVDQQQVEKEDLTYKLKILAEKVEEYKAEESNIRDALLSAQKLGTSILNEAKAKSDAVLNEAKLIYEELMTQGKAKVDSMTKESLQKAAIDLNEVRRECDRERVNLNKMKKEVSEFKTMVLRQYKNHLDMLHNLPDFEPKPMPQAAPQAERVQEKPSVVEDKAAINQVFNEQVSQDLMNEQNVNEPIIEQVQFDDTKIEEKVQLDRSNIIFGAVNTEPIVDKQTLFDQDSFGDDFKAINTTQKAPQILKSENSSMQEDSNIEEIVDKQTITSNILTNEKELINEEAEQTKEFNTDEDGDQEAFKINFGSKQQRPNYIEKFGELKFGGFGSDSEK